jgi:hypothetical protein
MTTATNPPTATTSAQVLRRSGLAGIAVPFVFLGLIVVLTVLEYDFLRGLGLRFTEPYDVAVPYPSSLARGDWGWLQIANFLALGALALVFLQGLRTQFRGRWSSRIATGALGVFGGAALLNAVPTSLPGDGSQWYGVVHFIGFLLTMLSMVVATLACGLALRRNAAWQGWWLASTLTMPLLLAAFVGHSAIPGALNFFVVLAVVTGWFAMLGWRMLGLSARGAIA